jgi:hypothetical protein
VTRFDRRCRIRLAIALPALLAIACGKGEKAAPPDSSASPPAPLVSTPGAGQSARLASAMPGALTKPIDEYTGEELQQLTSRLAFGGGHERERRCRNDASCAGDSPVTTPVRIDVVVGQDSVGPRNLPPYGVIQVRAVNKGRFEEARYGFKPDARREYYMIMTSDGSGGARWRLEELDRRSTPARHTQVGSGKIQDCGHRNWSPGARADFLSCASAASSARTDSVTRLGLLLQAPSLDAPIWQMCDDGCCIFAT